MNPTTLAMMPIKTNNVAQQSKTAVPNSTVKFGEALDQAMINNSVATDTSSSKLELTAEQTKTIKDLLAFLGVNSLTELKDGNAILTSLIESSGESESGMAELLANIVKNPDSKETKMNHVDSLLTDLLGDLLPKENQDQVDVPSEIYALLQKLDSFDLKDWSKLDINSTSTLLKLAKIQDLLASRQDLSQDAAMMQNEIKKLLESISGKLAKLVSSQSNSGNESTFSAALLENGSNKSLDLVKQVYVRAFSFEDEKTDQTRSTGVVLKTNETNSQSSGLPFQMTKLEQYVLFASKNGQAVDSEQFVKSFESILSKAHFSNTNGVQKLLIRLNPENLGSLRIELVQKDGEMVAKIVATTAQAKDLLDRQVQGLKHAFMNQNIQVEKIEISQQTSTFNAERFAPRDQGQNQQEQRQQQTKNEMTEDDETDFTDRFEEILMNLKV